MQIAPVASSIKKVKEAEMLRIKFYQKNKNQLTKNQQKWKTPNISYLPKALVAPNPSTAKRQFLLEIITDQDLCLSVLHTP